MAEREREHGAQADFQRPGDEPREPLFEVQIGY
jgi:hypothetical protein